MESLGGGGSESDGAEEAAGAGGGEGGRSRPPARTKSVAVWVKAEVYTQKEKEITSIAQVMQWHRGTKATTYHRLVERLEKTTS